MDARQMAILLRTKMRAATWPGGTQDVVLGNRVYVVCDGLEEEEIPGAPFALIHVGDYTADEKRPTLLDQPFNVVVVVAAAGDRLGEAAVLGTSRSGDVMGSTKGRGVLEVSRALLAAVEDLTGADGAPILVSLGSGSRARPVGEGRLVVAQQHMIRALCTAQPEYQAPPWFSATKSGADVDLQWALPGVPQPILQAVRVQYAAGSTPPATPTAGTTVYEGVDTSETHTPAGFPASYSIWAAYSETGASENQTYSEVERWTARTVT